MTNETVQPKNRTLTGIVVSDKMTKTVVVEVLRLKKDAKYQKYYKVSTRYKAHDEAGAYHTGDRVVIRETRPLSKDKRWIVVSKLEPRTS